MKEHTLMSIRVILEKKKRGDVTPSYDHVVNLAKEEGISEKEALMRLTTKLDPEEADGWLERQKEKIAKGEKPLEEKKNKHRPKAGRSKKYFGSSFYDFGLLHGDEGGGSAGDAGADGGGGDGNRKDEDDEKLEEEQLDEKRKKRKRKKKKKKKKKKGKRDACYHKVRARYDVWPSAYASGALVKCRKVGASNWGNKSKKTNEDIEKELELDLEFLQEVDELLTLDEKKKKKRKKKRKKSKLTSKPSSEKSLHHWFSRKGAKGKKKGWVDCNAPDGKGGYKSCGRSDGEKRKKYPACRPTPGACKKMKGSKGKSWGKKGSKKK